jgi:hypothetical protein
MKRNEKAALEFAPREAARESSPPTPRRIHESDSQLNSTRPRGPVPWRSLRELVDDGLLEVFIDTRRVRL